MPYLPFPGTHLKCVSLSDQSQIRFLFGGPDRRIDAAVYVDFSVSDDDAVVAVVDAKLSRRRQSSVEKHRIVFGAKDRFGQQGAVGVPADAQREAGLGRDWLRADLGHSETRLVQRRLQRRLRRRDKGQCSVQVSCFDLNDENLKAIASKLQIVC